VPSRVRETMRQQKLKGVENRTKADPGGGHPCWKNSIQKGKKQGRGPGFGHGDRKPGYVVERRPCKKKPANRETEKRRGKLGAVFLIGKAWEEGSQRKTTETKQEMGTHLSPPRKNPFPWIGLGESENKEESKGSEGDGTAKPKQSNSLEETQKKKVKKKPHLVWESA